MANLRFASYGCCRTTISPLQARGWSGKASHRLQVRGTLFLQVEKASQSYDCTHHAVMGRPQLLQIGLMV